MLKKFILIFTLATLATSLASADILPFSWSTSGSFSSTLGFTGVSEGAPIFTDAGGNLSGILLGTISMPNVAVDASGTFDLTVDFFHPKGSTDPAYATTPFTVTANVNGINDLLEIDFPAAQLLSFSGTDGTGSFTFEIPDVSFMLNGNVTRTFELKGNIIAAEGARISDVSVSAVPEPSSVILLCTALGGVGWKFRRRKRL